MEKTKLQIQSLYTLRNTYINILAILIGGVIGLMLIEQKSSLTVIFIAFGCSLIIFLFFIIINCIKKLQSLFKNMEELEK